MQLLTSCLSYKGMEENLMFQMTANHEGKICSHVVYVPFMYHQRRREGWDEGFSYSAISAGGASSSRSQGPKTCIGHSHSI